MEELFRELLGKTVDTAVNAGIQSLVTGQDYGDAFKQQAGLAALTAISGRDSPLDFFRQQQTPPQTQPRRQTTAIPVLQGTMPATRQMNPSRANLPPQGESSVTLPDLSGGSFKVPEVLMGGQTLKQEPDVEITDIDNRGIMEALGDVFTGDGGRMSALKQLFFPDPAGAPSAFRQFGPLGILGLIAAYRSGAFDPVVPEQPQPFGGVGGLAGLQAKYPGTYRLGVPQIARPAAMADGGFPRKTGAIAGPGTETSDDIPAMLSDGEFVMTAKAVRGAGDGNREAGIRRMYDMMNNFERSVA